MLSLPAAREPIADQNQLPTRSWWRYFNELFAQVLGIITGQTALTTPVLTVTVDNALILTNQTTDAGAVTGTLTNAPTAGNPAFWLRLQVNGVNYAVPLWIAV